MEVTAQKIFDTVVSHLLKQNKKAYGDVPNASPGMPPSCLYQSDDGCKCAVGCLIKDEFYSSSFEGLNLDSNRVQAALCKSLDIPFREDDHSPLLSFNDTCFYLLGALQRVHDASEPFDWPKHLKGLAERFKLEYKF